MKCIQVDSTWFGKASVWCLIVAGVWGASMALAPAAHAWERAPLLAQAGSLTSSLEYRRGYADGQRNAYNSDRDGEEYKAGYRDGEAARLAAPAVGSRDYQRGYADGQRVSYNSDRDTEEYKSGYRAGEAARFGTQAGVGSRDYQRAYADGQRGAYNSDRDTEEYKTGYRAGDAARLAAVPAGTRDYQRGYSDGRSGSYNSDRDSEDYKSGFRAGEASRRSHPVTPAVVVPTLPEDAFYACVQRAESGRRSNISVRGYKVVGPTLWEVYLAARGRDVTCVVESAGRVHT